MAPKPLVIRVDADLRDRLEQYAQQMGVPVSGLARHFIRVGLSVEPGHGDYAAQVAAAESAALEILWAVKGVLNRQLQGVLGDLTDSLDKRVLTPFKEAAERAGPQRLPETITVQGLRGVGEGGVAELVDPDDEDESTSSIPRTKGPMTTSK